MSRKGVVVQLASLALRPLLGDGADNLVKLVADRLTDRGHQVTLALERANQRAWKALEVSLVEPSWWGQCKSALNAAEEKAFRQQVQTFLRVVPLADLAAQGPEFRRCCLAELRDARQAGLLPGERLPPDEVAVQARAFSRYADPQSVCRADWQAVSDVVQELKQAGHFKLAQYVSLRPAQSQPLLVTAVRFFFRREVETDQELSRSLTFQQLETLTQAQEAAFRGLGDLLTRHGQKLDEVLTTLTELRQLAQQTRDDVDDVKQIVSGTRDELEARLLRMEQLMRQQYQELVATLARQANRSTEPAPLPPTIGSSQDQRRQVEHLLNQCRNVPSQQQPASSVAQMANRLEALARDYDTTRQRAFPFLSAPDKVPPAPIAPPPPAPPSPPTPRDSEAYRLISPIFLQQPVKKRGKQEDSGK
ncbi:MAG: hypothetical protein K2R98_04750 [Gemmataceae bacterium]|nr:hypothetical protein [Gemmataceae bacterium]